MQLGNSVEVEALNENPTIEQLQIRAEGLHNLAGQTRIRAEGAHNPPLAQRPRTDLGGTSGKNPSDGLVRPAQELAKSVTETSSKVREPKTYNEAVNNPINGNRWQEIIDEELKNLDSSAIDWKANVPGLQDKARYRLYYWAAQLPQLGPSNKTPPHCQASLEVSEGDNHSGHRLGK